MKNFVRLCRDLDGLTATNEKISVLADYFRKSPEEEIAWTIFFLSGRRLKSAFSSAKLRQWFLNTYPMPQWLFEESYAAVGDTAETISLLLPAPSDPSPEDKPLRWWLQEEILPLMKSPDEVKQAHVISWWRSFPSEMIFTLNKILTGAFRLGVSQRFVTEALSQAFNVSVASLNRKLLGDWEPTKEFIERLKSESTETSEPSQPYPFFLAAPLDKPPESLGEPADWSIEWKWDGIRGQVIQREGGVYIWSRGEELVTERFPELEAEGKKLPSGTVLDGEILAWHEGQPLPFHELQKRIGRKKLDAKILKEVPVHFVVYDLLEDEGKDLRTIPLRNRRERLAKILSPLKSERFHLPPELPLESWEQAKTHRLQAREHKSEGLMIKRLSSAYGEGRRREDWWKFKLDPLTCDAVLIYAQAGSGRRSNLHTDYTFAAWQDDHLVPIAKAYSGLDQTEIEELDRWVRRHTLEKFGPVRSVKPDLVFELGFEGIGPSSRHKSGVALRFPRILRWRKDKPATEADHVEELKKLIDERA